MSAPSRSRRPAIASPLSMEVLPECADLACTKAKLDARAKSKATGRSYERMFVRHWDTWSNGTRSHLFVAALGADGKAGAPVDLTRSLDADVPSKPFGGDEEFTFSPDGARSCCRRARRDAKNPGPPISISTRCRWTAPARRTNLTAGNPAWDYAAGIPQERRPRLPGDERGRDSNRIDLRSCCAMHKPAPCAPWRTIGIVRSHIWRQRPTAAPCWLPRMMSASTRCSPSTPIGARAASWSGDGQVTEFSAANDTIVYALASLAAPAELHAIRVNGTARPAAHLRQCKHARKAGHERFRAIQLQGLER